MRKYLLGLLLVFTFFGCSDPEKEVPLLMRQLKSRDAKVQSQAALKLGRIGSPHANKATKLLIPMLSDRNAGAASAAAFALRKIDTVEARRALDKATRNRKR